MSESSNQNAQRERRARRMLRKSVENQIHLACANVPPEAIALDTARLEARAWLVSCGYLTVEDLESLAKSDAIATARRRLDELMARPTTAAPEPDSTSGRTAVSPPPAQTRASAAQEVML